MSIPQQHSTVLIVDNQGAIKIAKNALNTIRSKYIDVSHHYLRQQVQTKALQLGNIATALMPADGPTKILKATAHTRHLQLLGLDTPRQMLRNEGDCSMTTIPIHLVSSAAEATLVVRYIY